MTLQQLDPGLVAYQILDENGKLVGAMPELSAEQLLALYRYMHMSRTFSNKIIALQRQGRATTFGSIAGQEASCVGMMAPMQPQDWLTTSYREVAALMVRGVPMSTLIYAFRGYAPAYPKETHVLPIQIVIATQMLHAVGLGMAAKIAGDPVVAVGACGDGATSEGDFNEALNFAGIFQTPVVLFVQNNGWAISVPRSNQTAAPTLAGRGAGFGVPSVLVDGNDILAVYEVMQQALARARSGGGPTLIEALTYRMGAHTTADDPTRYRPAADLEIWKAKDPIARFKRFLLSRHLLTEAQDEQLLAALADEINQAAEEAAAMPPPAPDAFFDDMTRDITPRLQEQREDLLRFTQNM